LLVCQAFWWCFNGDTGFTYPFGDKAPVGCCKSPCIANPVQICGGPNCESVLVITHPPFAILGCYAKTNFEQITANDTDYYSSNCFDAASAVGGAFFSLKNGKDCYVGKNSLFSSIM